MKRLCKEVLFMKGPNRVMFTKTAKNLNMRLKYIRPSRIVMPNGSNIPCISCHLFNRNLIVINLSKTHNLQIQGILK